MNTVHWHLLLNHLPIIGGIIGMGILVAGFVLKNNPIVKRTALGVFVFSAVFAIPAFLTGEGAEEAVENLPGVMESLIEEHEDLGKLFLLLVSTLGVVSLLALFADIKKLKAAKTLYFLVLLVGMVSIYFGATTGVSGGKVRHTEIRTDAQNVSKGEVIDSLESEEED
jgi:formate hydrogenlyase subunit 3/multisubunit Na+/H+ antiporter MnhD subunit